MNEAELVVEDVEAFGKQLLEILNHGMIALMISLGHRTRLFDVMAKLPAATSVQIATAAKLDERYVREWLAALVTARIVRYNALDKSYKLPAEHAALLTRAAAPNNMAAFMQYIPQLGAVEDLIIERFKHGGGVHYEEFHRFHEIMAEDSGQSVVPALFDHILPLVPGLLEQLERGIEVLDLGCGRGLALMAMARRFPNSRFVGYDFGADAVAWANAQAADLSNLRFAEMDAALLDEPARYDLITTFDAIHDQADPARVLRNIHRALKPGGVYLMQDIRASSHLERNMDHPIGPFIYAISTMHCMTVSLAHGGAGLGTAWGEELALQMLAEAGFAQVQVHQLAHDFQNSYYVMERDG